MRELLASGGLYASMWNRQREAEEAREKLAQIDDDNEAPNRAPPPIEDPLATRCGIDECSLLAREPRERPNFL